jgi:hypothetical protein
MVDIEISKQVVKVTYGDLSVLLAFGEERYSILLTYHPV